MWGRVQRVHCEGNPVRKETLRKSDGCPFARGSPRPASETPRESLEATARNTLGNPANLPTALRHRITYLHVAKFESIATADIAL